MSAKYAVPLPHVLDVWRAPKSGRALTVTAPDRSGVSGLVDSDGGTAARWAGFDQDSTSENVELYFYIIMSNYICEVFKGHFQLSNKHYNFCILNLSGLAAVNLAPLATDLKLNKI